MDYSLRGVGRVLESQGGLYYAGPTTSLILELRGGATSCNKA